MELQSFRVYLFSAALLLWMLLSTEVRAAWIPAAWVLESAGIVWLGMRLQDRVVRLTGAGGCLLALLRLLGEIGQWDLWAAALVVAVLYSLSMSHRAFRRNQPDDFERWAQQGYALVASLVLTVLFKMEIDRHWVSVAWALEGLGLISVGFGLRDKLFRWCGLGVFALLVLKILFVDLAGAETIYRILSFIIAGAMLLAASFAYTKFSGRDQKEAP